MAETVVAEPEVKVETPAEVKVETPTIELTPEEKAEIENINKGTPEVKKEGAVPEQKKDELTEEIKIAAQNFQKLYSVNPELTNFILNGGDIATVLSEVLPKGKDYTNEKKDVIYKEYLIAKGLSAEDIETEMKDYVDMRPLKRTDADETAITYLQKNKPTIDGTSIPKIFKSHTDKLSQQNAIAEKANKELIAAVTTEITVGKDFNGVKVTEDNIKALQFKCAKAAPVNGDHYDIKKGIADGIKAFTFDKVVGDLTAKLAVKDGIIRKLTNPNADIRGGVHKTITPQDEKERQKRLEEHFGKIPERFK